MKNSEQLDHKILLPDYLRLGKSTTGIWLIVRVPVFYLMSKAFRTPLFKRLQNLRGFGSGPPNGYN